jgi:hypothetical protein
MIFTVLVLSSVCREVYTHRHLSSQDFTLGHLTVYGQLIADEKEQHMPDDTVDATFHVQIEPYWSRWETTNGEKLVTGAKMINATQARPGKQKPGTVMVKLTVRLPKAAFYPLRPEAVVIVPASLIEATPVEVTAEAPGESS